MTTVEEGTHSADDGFQLYIKTWKTPNPKARLLFVHGFSDHCNQYETLFPSLASRGIQVHAFDQRGWGRSVHPPSERGLTGPTSTVLADITSMLRTLLPSPSSPSTDTTITTPVFLMGHSMGGGEVLTYASEGPGIIVSQLTGVLAEAPLIALHSSTRPWKGTVVAGRMAARFLPRMKMVNKLDPSNLSHDAEANKSWSEDPLCHDTGTLEGLAGMLDRGERLENGTVVLKEGRMRGGKSRVWVGHGDMDRVNLFEASERWVERLEVEDKTLRRYKGAFHNLHVEPAINGLDGKEVFANDVGNWIIERVDDNNIGQSQSKL